MKMVVPSVDDLEQVRIWRNVERQFLRTPYFLTAEMQEDFYNKVVCDRASMHRYYALIGDDVNQREHLFGLGGITNIEWENGCGEISLIMNPQIRGKGYGRMAVDMMLNEGFGNLGLETIYGEVYYCGNWQFWKKLVDERGGYTTDLIGRKRWHGDLYNSMWFAFRRDEDDLHNSSTGREHPTAG